MIDAITDATERLADLHSYRFEVGIAGGRYVDYYRDEYQDFVSQGALTRDPKLSVDGEVLVSSPAVFGEEASSRTTPFLVIDDEIWETPAGQSARPTAAGRRAFAATMYLEGTWSADLWIAKRGGYLLAADIRGEPPPDSPEWLRAFDLQLNVRDANDPDIAINPPG